MALDLLKNIASLCPRDANLMGLDVGSKTIGVALSTYDLGIATPYRTIKRKKFRSDLTEIEKIAREFQIGGYVIGYPITLDGNEGVRCQSVRDFALEFIKQLAPDLKPRGERNLWVALWDERLSTAFVEDFVDEHVDKSFRKLKEKGCVDKIAAQFILQGALDYVKNEMN